MNVKAVLIQAFMSQASIISMLATIYHVRVVSKRPNDNNFSLTNAKSRTHSRMSRKAIGQLTFIRCRHEIGPHHVYQQSSQLPCRSIFVYYCPL